MVVIKKSAVKDLMKEVSGMKVSPTVVEEIDKLVESHIKELTEKLSALAEHAKRKTIKKDDVDKYTSIK